MLKRQAARQPGGKDQSPTRSGVCKPRAPPTDDAHGPRGAGDLAQHAGKAGAERRRGGGLGLVGRRGPCFPWAGGQRAFGVPQHSFPVLGAGDMRVPTPRKLDEPSTSWYVCMFTSLSIKRFKKYTTETGMLLYANYN